MSEKFKIAVTGANGLVGRHLVLYLESQDYQVFRLQRNAPKNISELSTYRYFNLRDEIPEDLLSGMHAVIHCAFEEYNSKQKSADEINLKATRSLLQNARKHGAKFIFLSTLSAHEAAESHYGRNKYEIEKLFDLEKDIVLRLGLVMAPGGLASQMVGVLSKAKFLPLIGQGVQPLQTIHIDDLSKIIEIAATSSICGTFNIAESKATTMRNFYSKIAEQIGKQPKFIPVPFWLVHCGVKCMEALGLSVGITSENTLGLKHMRSFQTEGDLQNFGIKARPFEESLTNILN